MTVANNSSDRLHARRSEISLGIVTPMANEEENAEAFVREVLAQCAGVKRVGMFVVLDKVCRDATRSILENLQREIPALQVIWAPENRHVVDAYVRGYREALRAGCDWILEIDAGYSHQPADIPQFFDRMEEGFDCVFGSRFSRGGSISGSSLKRRIISYGGTRLVNVAMGTTLQDMTGGFELFTREALEGVLEKGLLSRSPFFQTEIKIHCRTLRVCEVPIQYRSASHSVGWKALHDSFRNLWRLFRLRLTHQL
jgi:dolichol-phosphate mannosyltransferase